MSAAADDAHTARHASCGQVVGHGDFNLGPRCQSLPSRQVHGDLVEVLLVGNAFRVVVATALHHFQLHATLIRDGIRGGGGHQKLDARAARNGLGRLVDQLEFRVDRVVGVSFLEAGEADLDVELGVSGAARSFCLVLYGVALANFVSQVVRVLPMPYSFLAGSKA